MDTLYTVNHVNIADLLNNCEIIHQMLNQNKPIYYGTTGNHALYTT